MPGEARAIAGLRANVLLCWLDPLGHGEAPAAPCFGMVPSPSRACARYRSWGNFQAVQLRIVNDLSAEGMGKYDFSALALTLDPQADIELGNVRFLVHLDRACLADERPPLAFTLDPELVQWTPTLTPIEANVDLRASLGAGRPVSTLVRLDNNLCDAVKYRRQDEDRPSYELRVDCTVTSADGRSTTTSAQLTIDNPWFGRD